jgi:aspartate/methionine/tyrosine aminotransferase
VQATGQDARRLADLLLDTAGVAVLAGTALGGRGGLPAAVVRELLANLEEALDQMQTVLETGVPAA